MFQQGELEKHLEEHATISPFCDRDSTDTSKVTLGYMLVVIQFSIFL